MKLTVEERPIEKIGVGTEQTFRVKGTPKAFRILSSSLYSDKITAIIRELSCNAWDSHKAAGKGDVPIFVHLPNALESDFRVRDDGLGLAHEDVLTLCTTYFESTKTDSNDMIGALGLGMKSPFSYVDSFTLVSRFAGEKRTYTMFINEDGMPAVAQMGVTEKTDECNGVEIIVPVRSTDYYSFSHRAERVFEFFNPMPIVEGVHEFKAAGVDSIILRGSNFTISHSHHGSARAIMGMIAYPINFESFSNDITDDRNDIKHLCSRNIDIQFEIGELDITAGREELSYDRKITIPNLIRKLNDVQKELRVRIDAEFSACKTEWEARLKYHHLRSLIYFPFIWNGKRIDGNVFLIAASKCKELWVHRYEDKRSTRVHESYNGFSFEVTDRTIFCIDDGKRGTISRARHMAKMTNHVVYLVGGPDEHIDAFRTMFEGAPFVLASELEKPPVLRKPVSVKHLPSLFSFARRYLTEITVTDEDHGYYVRMTGSKFIVDMENTVSSVHKAKDVEIENLLPSILRWANAWKILQKSKEDEREPKLIFIPKSLSKDFVDNPNWVELFPYLRERALAQVKKIGIGPIYTHRLYDKLCQVDVDYRFIEDAIRSDPDFVDHPLLKYFNYKKRIGQNLPDMNQYSNLKRDFLIHIPEPDPDISKWKSILDQYMILKYIDKFRGNTQSAFSEIKKHIVS